MPYRLANGQKKGRRTEARQEWWLRPGSNRGAPNYEFGALPTELRNRLGLSGKHASHELVEPDLIAAAMVGDQVVPDADGSDLVPAFTGTSQLSPCGDLLGSRSGARHGSHPGADKLQRKRLVGVLGAPHTDFHFNPCRDVPDANGTFRLIAMLPAGALPAHRFDVEVLLTQRELICWPDDHGHDRDGRGMNAPVSLGGRDPLPPVTA